MRTRLLSGRSSSVEAQPLSSLRSPMTLLAVLAPLSGACVGTELPDVQRRDAAADSRADGSVSMDAALDAGALDARAPDTGVVSPMDAAREAAADASMADAPAEIACRTVCGASCTDTQVDPRNCGACFRDCANLPGVDPGAARCLAGLCVINRACMPNRGDCNGDASDGCETDLGTTTNCGVCGTRCVEPSPICTMMPGDGGPAMFRCGSGCVAPTPDRCASRCVDLQTDRTNCGACGTVCPAAVNGVGACVMGRCQVTCNAGFGDCDGNAANGCETPTAANITHCGACGNVCPGVMGASPACVMGRCGIACAAGTGNCDMDNSNGCETDTRANLNNCGTCGRVCAPAPNAAPTCASSVCSTTCNAGFANCNASAVDGCEIEINTNPLHCGMCNRRCTVPANATASCAMGGCGFTCNAGFGDCNMLGSDGCEVSTNTNPAHCGGCGMACPARANATLTCAAGACGFACSAGFGNCDADATNGCETNTATSMAHCGGCGMACSPVANSTAACAAGRCAITCDAGFRLVGATCERTPPTPVFPWTGATVTNRRPVFRVVLPAGQTGGTIEVCTNRTCTSIETTFALTGSSGTPTVDLAVNRHYFWRVIGLAGGAPTAPSAASHFIVSANGGATGHGAMGVMLNPNGDNVGDWVGGAPTSNRVVQYIGLGASTLPSGTTQFGFSVSSAGDVNSDGLTDYIAGTPGVAPGSVSVFYANGSSYPSTASATLAAPAAVTRFGDVVRGIGDVNGDGFADIAVATRSNRVLVYTGSPAGLVATPARDYTGGGTFGTTIARACDINGDSYADLIVGSEANNAIYIYPGSATGLAMTATTLAGPDPMRTAFGRSVDCAGDTNGDGYADVIVGAYDAARAFVYGGSATGLSSAPIATLGAAPSAANHGYVVGGVGDYDGDQFADVVVSASTSAASGSGFTVIYWGSATGPSDTGAVVLPSGVASVTSLGFSITSGDISGDGRSDILIGQPSLNTVRYYQGRTRALTTVSSSLAPGYSLFGNSVSAQ